VIECPKCHTQFTPDGEAAVRWTDDGDVNPDYGRAVEQDASARLEVDTVREPVAPPENVLRAEIGVKER
jgi:hypothetical protein